ncbi:MAG: ABC transporter ATP-binding protein [Kiritimatiellia bacterium]|jgi:branched-chain amino acid transport system ATP-binding protein|nr:ABC transporter ATP-binding protein [Kiritimatiellia bacterium]
MDAWVEIILKAEGLKKHFGGVRAVDGVDFSLRKGEISSIIGPNGAGKTSLFNLLTGHVPPDSGTVIFKEETITKLSPHQICKRGIGRSFQRINIFSSLPVFVNVQVAVLSQQGKSLNLFSPARNLVRRETLQILESAGLEELAGHTAGSLSHGDQKRVELAIALANNPDLLLLDEPTAGMSPQETASSIELIERVTRERGLTLLFTEHDMDMVFSISQTVTVMHQGRIIASGTPREVRSNENVQRVYLGETI